jgi:predicted permease
LDHFFPREFRVGKPKTAPEYWWLRVMGRLKAGVTTETAATELTASFRRGLQQSGVPVLEALENPRVVLHPGDRGLSSLRDSVRQPLLVLLGVAGMVLLLACVNVAVLQLARASARSREIALRVALGATRFRILGQLLVESMLLAVLGAAAGCLVALWGAPFIAKMLTEPQVSVALDLTPDLRVLLFTTLAVVVTGVLFGVHPALRAVRTDITPNLRPTGAAPTGSDSFTTGRMLMSLQVALSVVLLAGAGLLLRSLWNLNRMDLGFQRDRLLVFRLDPGQSGASLPQAAALHDRVLDEVRRTPGVISATAMAMPLITGWHNGAGVSVPRGPELSTLMNTVSPDYFSTMEMPLLSGRTFRAEDAKSKRAVAILNQTAAKRLFGDSSAIGMVVNRHSGEKVQELEVIGVVRDAKYAAMRNEIAPTLFMTWAGDDRPFTVRSYTVRTAGDPLAMTAALRQAIAGVNRDLVMMDVKTQTQLIDENLHQERLFASLLTLFGGFALTLAAIGLYGVTAYLTGRRTAEIGIRVALGSSSHRVLRLFAGQMLIPVLFGTIAGLGAAWAGVRLIESMLFGVDKLDAITLGAVVVLLLAIATGAVLWPAWRASRIDPMTALRSD